MMISYRDGVPTVIVTLLVICYGVVAQEDPINQDLTTNREFGCRWYGGSSARVSCHCWEGAEMFIQRNSIPSYSTTEIEVDGCKTLRLAANSIADIQTLRHLRLNNIGSITFDEESLNWYGYKDARNQDEERFDLSIPSLKISISNSNATLISSHTFKGRINEITLDGVHVERILPFAFANLLQTENILIKNSVLNNVDLQAFKKFQTENLELDGVTADLVPSRTFSNVTVHQRFLINNCRFETVRSGAFSIYNPEIFQVTNTNIGQLDGEAFKVISRGNVLFRNNTINIVNDGAFRGITLKRGEVLANTVFTFDTNTFGVLTRESLTISDFSAKFVDLYLNATCDCQSIDHNIRETAYYSDIKCLRENEYVTVKDYKSHMCSVISNYFITIIVSCVVGALLVIVVSALVFYYKVIHRSKKYGSEKQSKSGNNLSLIVPDGRTYRETELHVIVEKTDLLTTDL